jgi:hypothetical protein
MLAYGFNLAFLRRTKNLHSEQFVVHWSSVTSHTFLNIVLFYFHRLKKAPRTVCLRLNLKKQHDLQY